MTNSNLRTENHFDYVKITLASPDRASKRATTEINHPIRQRSPLDAAGRADRVPSLRHQPRGRQALGTGRSVVGGGSSTERRSQSKAIKGAGSALPHQFLTQLFDPVTQVGGLLEIELISGILHAQLQLINQLR